MRNYLRKSLWITISVIAILLLLYFLPTIKIGDYSSRRIDLLSDIRKSDVAKDSVVLPLIKVAYTDSCRDGKTCIEDFGDSTRQGMSPFYDALDRIAKNNGVVRIAVLGDSFIEADIFTADLREMLQNRYGGCGVGFLTINSLTGAYRPTVHQKSSGFISHSALDHGFDKSKEGLSGHYFVPSTGAYVELKGQDVYASRLDTCYRSSILFVDKNGGTNVSVSVNGGPERVYSAVASPFVQSLQVDGKIGSVRWTVKQPSSSLFYGVTMDSNKGIVVDNFSLRGNSGFNLRNITTDMLKGFDKARHYDLIIMQYGLNVVNPHCTKYEWYERGLLKSIAHMKECFPHTGFLLMGVSDRDQRSENGDFRTIPAVKIVLRYQEKIASETGIAFWNTFEAMGGDESMSRLVHSNPSMANYDYTHINFHGGKYLAQLFYDALMWGKQQYDKKGVYVKR
jgi:hypothetical protein